MDIGLRGTTGGISYRSDVNFLLRGVSSSKGRLTRAPSGKPLSSVELQLVA
jgi:hypothetical protein